MKLTAALFSAFIILFSSCSNTADESATSDSLEKKSNDSRSSTTTNSSDCYRYVNNNDTVVMKITENDGAVSGTLMYDFFEKDKNTGTIKGEMKGDMLLAQYTFMSEGMESVRAVAFKKMGKNFIEGSGESEAKNGQDVFKNIDSLSFSNSVMLSPYDCGK